MNQIKPGLLDRAQAAMLGLALGDAYGQPLEFIGLPEVRTHPVKISKDHFRWTDDTHMAMYLGQALLDLSPGPVDLDALGHAIGARFVEWLRDPLTPSTAPGGTCLRGAERYERSRSWRRSGDPNADGCGAVMRICPLPIALSGEALTESAQISASVTHGHPNAIEAAVAACHLLRWTLERGRFDAGMVRHAALQAAGPWSHGGIVSGALTAALNFSRQPDIPRWLDEASIPDGGGGWRSASALGLAVAAALTWGDDFATAVEKAARIQGDSDSVACLTGMFLGAAGGTRALPQRWLEALPARSELTKMAAALYDWSQAAVHAGGALVAAQPRETDAIDALREAGARLVRLQFSDEVAVQIPKDDERSVALLQRLAARYGKQIKIGERLMTLRLPKHLAPLRGEALQRQSARTSQSDPLRVDWIDAGLPGQLGVTLAPGKKCESWSGPAWERDLAQDLDRLVAVYQTDTLICLLTDAEMASLQIPELVSEAEARRILVHRLPVTDGDAPGLVKARQAVALICAVLRAGRRVVLHCRGGLGRAGTLAACALIRLGRSPEEATREVRAVRPGAIENEFQRAFLDRFERHLKRG